MPQYLYFIRKRRKIEKEDLMEKLKLHISRPLNPKTLTDLFRNYFRAFNIETKVCDCSDFFKYGYCKHYLAYKEIKAKQEPLLKPQKKKGRKPKNTGAWNKNK